MSEHIGLMEGGDDDTNDCELTLPRYLYAAASEMGRETLEATTGLNVEFVSLSFGNGPWLPRPTIAILAAGSESKNALTSAGIGIRCNVLIAGQSAGEIYM